MPDSSQALANLVVLVTRPAHQAEALRQILTRMGAEVVQHALLNIAPPADSNSAQRALARVEDADIVIFTSTNAVRAALMTLPQFAASLHRPQVACLGMGTARELQKLAIVPDIMPTVGNTSEHLLALDEMSGLRVEGRRIIILKGDGGRSMLFESLSDRGAQVEVINVYRRELVGDGLQQVFESTDSAKPAKVDIAIVSSGEALQRMCEVVTHEHLLDLALVLPSDRVVEQAIALGLRGPFEVPGQVNDGAFAQAAIRLAKSMAAGKGKQDNE